MFLEKVLKMKCDKCAQLSYPSDGVNVDFTSLFVP